MSALPQPKNEPAGEAARDFLMTDDDFHRVARMVEAMAGIILKDHKRQMVYTRLSRRLRALGIDTFAAYLDLVDSPAGAAEVGEFANAVTTNLTSFFREAHHFEHLSKEVLTPLTEAGARRIRIWSAGCSTGEEPYTIGMTALSQPSFTAGRDLRILATDLDTNVLATGRAGEYPSDKLKGVPEALRRAHMSPTPTGAKFNDRIKSLISFRQLNLLHDWPFKGPFDVIFCRNVVIYFDTETKNRLVNRYAQMLTPNGVLYLGHSESLLGEHPLLRSEGRTIYRRRT
ncbi:CheR family methyltransferase [Rhodovulum sp. DZ06]|uniref:CheR family methyltransferase n=1 Tax=Rhodovulum sp. DZ06 TaxID=3425126 RepID=UPI003D34BBEC